MKTVDINKAQHFTVDSQVYGSKDFRDLSTKLWRDNLNFNIFDGEGYYTQQAKDFVKDNRIKRKADETWADAIFRYAERYQLGYQCDKAPTKRSDVKFSGSMIMSTFIKHQEGGTDYKPSRDNFYGDLSSDEISYIDELTFDSYK